MRSLTSILPVLAALLLLVFPARAEEAASSANWVMPGCRAWVDERNNLEPVKAPWCAGTVSGVADSLIWFGFLCLPGEVTTGQIVRVVTQWIDQRPERQHEAFSNLTAQSLMSTWPCPVEKRWVPPR
jgi:hypothetical protein